MHGSERRNREKAQVPVLPALQRQVQEQRPAPAPVIRRPQVQVAGAPPVRQSLVYQILAPDLARSPFTAQRKAVSPVLQAAGHSREDRQLVQASTDRLAVQRQALEQSGETLNRHGLTPAPQHLLDRNAPRTEPGAPPLTPRDLEERTKALGQESLAVLNQDAGYLPFHVRAELACHALEAGRKQGIEVESLRQALLQGVQDPLQQETLRGLFQRQDQGRLQATRAQADHLLLVQHAQLQRAADQAQQAHDELSEHTALERVQARRGGGQPLPEDVRRQLELGLNHNLSGVRLHLDAEADLIARSLGALAFTSGKDIYFRAGEYNPASKLDLLAHEAAHVRQQDQGQVAPGLDPDAGLESQAQKFGEEFALGQASGSKPKGQVTAQKTTAPTAPAAPQLAVQRLADPAPAAGFWFSPKWTHQFTGTLGKSHVTMTLTRSGDQVTGTYQYQGHTGSLSLNGTFSSLSNMASLTELDLKSPEGAPGTAKLVLSADSDTAVRGSWVSGGKDLPISLTVADVARQHPQPSPTPQQSPSQIPQSQLPAPQPASPPDQKQASPGPFNLTALRGNQLLTARIYNLYHTKILEVAGTLGIKPEVLIGIVLTESQGTAGVGGRMLIRFEVHKFYEGWGQQHPQAFGQHFRFNRQTTYLGHQSSPDGKQWQSVHPTGTARDTAQNYAALGIATALGSGSAEPAYAALGMGLGQVQGFNYQGLGYRSATDMFQKLSASEEEQLQSVARFIQGRPKLLKAAREENWANIELYYNGGGQKGKYAATMQSYVSALLQVAAAQGINLSTGTGPQGQP